MKKQVNYIELKGEHKEIGKELAKYFGLNPLLRQKAPPFFTENDFKDAMNLYEKYCPGIKEEIEGFSESTNIPIQEICYTWMTYLIPRCCGIILSKNKTEDGHTKILRGYDFNEKLEDLTLYKTKAINSYSHIGCGVCIFGRNEGINEHGLAVSMASTGMPVSNIPSMNPPKIKGLQYWAVIRSLLDTCKNCEEALQKAMEIPIAFNINLFLADQTGTGILFETIDGQKMYKIIKKDFIFGTNHIVIPELTKFSPMGMKNSVIRYNLIQDFLNTHEKVNDEQSKELLLTKYPNGLCFHAYEQYMGTISSIILDTDEKKLSICWFGLKENEWEDFYIDKEFKTVQKEKIINYENIDMEEFKPILFNIVKNN